MTGIKRPWHIWLSFVTCLALVAAAVGWLSLRALHAERAELAAREQAALEENVRLALWRMDSALSAFLAQENARPFDAYRTTALSSRGRAREAAPSAPAPAGSPAPNPPEVRLYFQVFPDGGFTSPELTVKVSPRADGPGGVVASRQEQARKLLVELQQLTSYAQLFPELPAPVNAADPVLVWSATQVDQLAQSLGVGQVARNGTEFRNRSQVLKQSSILNNLSNNTIADKDPALLLDRNSTQLPVVGILAPIVSGNELLLARRAQAGGRDSIQGAWLDWPVIRDGLRAQIADLLPDARFELFRPGTTDVDQGRRLALLPIEIDPGPPAVDRLELPSPVRLSLIAAWGAMALAALAVAALLGGVVTLSERRADFVSAVTHELRTPLTTFRMYAEMLSSGMIDDDTKRRQYLETLRVEADRLTHLVENVLAYARLERGGLGNRIQTVTGEELLSAATERLAERAAQAEFVWETQLDAAAKEARVLADPSAVEQILFNLVDNACKYAAAARDRTLSLHAAVSGNAFVVRLADRGPGFSIEQRRRLFQPFRKSATEAARSAPGVGLGLSLSRRLARDMGGDLRPDPSATEGAALELTLRLARR